jgi:hypothetical protein
LPRPTGSSWMLGPEMTPAQVREWLSGYSIKVVTSTLHDNMPTIDGPRAVGAGPNTADLPKLTAEHMAKLTELETEFDRPQTPEAIRLAESRTGSRV